MRGGNNDFGSNASNKFALVLGASVGLVAILMHSVVDFNMQVPANAILAVTLMALLSTHLRFATDDHWVPGRMWVKILATLVEWGNGRNTVWKNLQNQTTACRGVVAPDDASCVEDDVSPMMFAGHDGKGDDLELSWTRPIVDGPARVVVTIPDGLDRDSADQRWWTVRYCSAATAEIDVRGGLRVVIDAATGDAKVIHVAVDAPPCA